MAEAVTAGAVRNVMDEWGVMLLPMAGAMFLAGGIALLLSSGKNRP